MWRLKIKKNLITKKLFIQNFIIISKFSATLDIRNIFYIKYVKKILHRINR